MHPTPKIGYSAPEGLEISIGVPSDRNGHINAGEW